MLTGRPFTKGISGNPGGRTKAQGDMRELARQYGPEALLRMVEIMRGDDARAAIAAAAIILDRGFGKPVQAVQSEAGGSNVMYVQWLPPVTPEQERAEQAAS